MLNIVIPMAGAGSRFVKAGYKDPKPLIDVNSIPMIQLVIDNLRPKLPHRFIFICQAEHVKAYGLQEKLLQWASGAIVATIDGLTDGAACTVLSVRNLINTDAPLMIANSDQYIDCDMDAYLNEMHNRHLDGLIMTMQANDPKWSFVGYREDNLVGQVVEKRAISNDATVGVYNFCRGSDFVYAAEKMIAANDRANNEFYVAPVYNYLIADGQKIGTYNIGEIGNGMYGLGTPDDLMYFLKNPISKKFRVKS